MRPLIQDGRRAWRSIGRAPGASLFVVAVITTAVAAALAILSVADAVLWRGLGAPDSARLVRLFPTDEKGTEVWNSTSYPVFSDYRDQARTLEAVAAYSDDHAVHLRFAGAPLAEQGTAGVASGRFFEILGARAAKGRLFDEDDDRRGAEPVVVLSAAFDRRTTGSDGKRLESLTINGHVFTVIGVLPADFVGAEMSASPQVWLPIVHHDWIAPRWAEAKPLENRRFSWVRTVARLRPGVTIAAAQTELDVIAAARASTQTRDPDPWARVVPAEEVALGLDRGPEANRLAAMLVIAVSVLLAAAATNASTVLLAQGERRSRETALARALGAPTSRVVGPAVIEGLSLAVAGVGGGWLLAPAALGLLRRVSEGVPLPLWAATDLGRPRTLLLAGLVFVIVAVLAGLAPVIRQSRISALQGLAMAGRTIAGGTAGTSGRARVSLREALVATQAALAVVLLLATGLLLRSVESLRSVDLGFEPRGVVVGNINPSLAGYDGVRARLFVDQLLDDLRREPGVVAAGAGRSLPLYGTGMRMTPTPEGYVPQPDEDMGVAIDPVNTGFFESLRIGLREGRTFGPQDRAGTPLVAVVNQAFVDRFWPGAASTIGRTIAGVGFDSETVEVVGVVDTTRVVDLREGPTPVVYIPQSQFLLDRTTVVVRGSGSAADSIARLRRVVARLDPGVPLVGARPLGDRIDAVLVKERALLFCFGAFAAVVVLLEFVGLYGALVVTVQRRRRELGLRRALGASSSRLFTEVLRRGLLICAFGTIVGLAVAAAMGRGLASVLFGVRPWDPPTILAALLVVLVGAGLGAWGPAWRAVRIDPAVTLREE